MIAKYEAGTSKPDIGTIIQISNVLHFPVEFFYKSTLQNTSAQSPLFFRSKAIPKKTKDAMEQKVDFVREIVCFLETYIDLPEFQNDFDVANMIFLSGANEEIENISMELRLKWGLEDKPINNLTNVLLRKGYILTRSYNNNIKIDAYSKLIERPYVVLGADKNCCVRSRYDLAHELGHSILHYEQISNDDLNKYHKTIEDHANRFASSFLMPAASFARDIDSVSLDSFIYLKRKWKVSISAMVRRCYDLHLIDHYQYTLLNKSISARGWKHKEPLDNELEYETPNLFRQAFEILFSNNLVNTDESLLSIALHSDEIENICCLDDDYFRGIKNGLPKPRLRTVK